MDREADVGDPRRVPHLPRHAPVAHDLARLRAGVVPARVGRHDAHRRGARDAGRARGAARARARRAPARAALATPCAATSRSGTSRSPTRRRRARRSRDVSVDVPAGTTLGIVGPVGCGQEHAARAAAAPLRRARRDGLPRRDRREPHPARGAPRGVRVRPPGRLPLRRHDPREPRRGRARPRRPGAGRGGRRGGGPLGRPRGLPRGPRHRGGRARHHALGRPAPARHDRARAPRPTRPILVLDDALSAVDIAHRGPHPRRVPRGAEGPHRPSSWPTASPPCATPTASSCSTAGSPSRAAPTTSSSRATAGTRAPGASSGCAPRSRSSRERRRRPPPPRPPPAQGRVPAAAHPAAAGPLRGAAPRPRPRELLDHARASAASTCSRPDLVRRAHRRARSAAGPSAGSSASRSPCAVVAARGQPRPRVPAVPDRAHGPADRPGAPAGRVRPPPADGPPVLRPPPRRHARHARHERRRVGRGVLLERRGVRLLRRR